jgi:hypothetical protein
MGSAGGKEGNGKKIEYVEIFLSMNLSNLNIRQKYSRIEGRGFEGE